MRLVFLGTPEAAVVTMQALVGAGHEVVLAVTRPDRPAGRSLRPMPPPVKRAAVELGIEVLQAARVRDEAFIERLRDARAELLVVVAYGRILPRPVLDVAPLGAVNLHFSLLPRYRGAAPVQWALARGDDTTGVTTMQMNERLDEGDVWMQREVPIEDGEHAPALEARLARIGAELLIESLAGLEAGSLVPRPQDDARATLAPLLSAADGWLDPRLSAREIEGRVRGFDPWPGVWGSAHHKRLRLVRARALGGPVLCESLPGTVVELTEDGLVVACGGGSRLLLSRIQAEGRRPVGARDAVNGRLLRPGDRLEGGPETLASRAGSP